MKLLQDFVVPYVRIERRQGRVLIAEMHGTAFFINSSGAFLTAGHVIQSCEAKIKLSGGEAAIVMHDRRHPGDRFAGIVEHTAFAPAPYDIAIASVNRPTTGYFFLGTSLKAWMWEEVFAAGYPSSATAVLSDNFRIDARGHKGEILRKVPAGRVLLHPHPDVIEVSFAITKGMSGSPLVMRNVLDSTGNPIEQFGLLGVCVGNERSEIVEHTLTEVIEGGARFSEKVARVEEYGIVHDLRPLSEWRADGFNGKTLTELIRPTAE